MLGPGGGGGGGGGGGVFGTPTNLVDYWRSDWTLSTAE